MNDRIQKALLIWIVFFGAGIAFGCAGGQPIREQYPERVPLGLYKVMKRECAYPPDVPEDCSKTQYIELVKGVFRSVQMGEIAFATWLSENPATEHLFNVRDMRQGKFLNEGEYVIENSPLGKEWFIIKHGTITDYYFVRNARETPMGNMAGKTHLTLQIIARTKEINRILRYAIDSE